MRGFTANSFTSVSINPLLVSMSVVKDLYTGQLIDKSNVYTVNILKASQQEWGMLFAGMYPERTNRFEGIDIMLPENGCPVLPDVAGWLSCRVYKKVDLGASVMMIGEVMGGGFHEQVSDPLLYYQRQWGTFQPE